MGNDIKTYKVKLQFRGPVHFGNKENTYNSTDFILHSDTIFSGIINCIGLLYGKKIADEVVDMFLRNIIPFKISSAFLYKDDEYYIPKPLDFDLYDLFNDYKESKKVKYIPLSFLKKQNYIKDLDKDAVSLSKGHLLINEANGKLFEIIERPRVLVDRVTSSSNIYYVSECYFNEGTGLWFYLDIIDKGLEKNVLSAIKLLGDEGLGGERTYGLGLFEPDFIVDDNREFINANKFLSLSLIYPKDDEKISSKLKYFTIIERGGYAFSLYTTELKRKRVRMVSEGSVFDKQPYGAVIDVAPNNFDKHKIVRYGIAYTYPLYD